MKLFSNLSLLKKLIILVIFFHISFSSYSQNKTIQGIVSDLETGELLSGATISLFNSTIGTYSDSIGYYSLSLPAKETHVILCSYIGYEKKEIEITQNSPVLLNIQLISNSNLSEVVISYNKEDENITTLSMGLEKMNIKDIKQMPALMGEVDVLKAIQLLPGVQPASEGGSGYSVRGGSPDQNLVVLDNTTIYNPSHLMGFFSVFNNDVISDIELYKGNFPFKFGGRLSSLLEVKTRKEMPDKLQGTGGIGLISSRIMLEGPIKEKTWWLLGGRRSYADLFLKLASDKDIRNTIMYFYDLNGKMSHSFSKRDKIELNAYYGLDKFGAQPGEFNYGNAAVSLTWNHIFRDNLLGKFSAHYTDYKYDLASNLKGAQMNWESSITDWMIRADFRQNLSELWNFSYGINAIYHRFNPGLVKMEKLDAYSVPGKKSIEQASYISNDQQLSNNLSLRYGLRFSFFHNIGDGKHTYSQFEPGIGSVFQLNKKSSLKANYSRNTQYMQLANNSASGSPLDVWFSASIKVKPQKVDMFSLGFFQNLENNNYETSIEIYYKNLKNVIDFKEHTNLVLNENLEDEISTGSGKAYGVEFMVKKNKGRLTGFVNYTLSRSERTIPEINEGKSYLAPYDKTHAVNIFATYFLNKKWNFSLAWIFATGNPTTYPVGRFDINGEYFPIYSKRNEYRKPNYDRLDLSINYIPKADSNKKWKGEWSFSIYNVYNRKNPWTITYDQDNLTGIPYAEMLYLFGIVPSITYNIKF